jgi:hypothetical protein
VTRAGYAEAMTWNPRSLAGIALILGAVAIGAIIVRQLALRRQRRAAVPPDANAEFDELDLEDTEDLEVADEVDVDDDDRPDDPERDPIHAEDAIWSGLRDVD